MAERERFRIRDKTVKLRCTETEKLAIEKLALENNMSVNTYLCKMALEGFVIQVDFAELKNLIYEVNRIGNNVNQIAHRVNTNDAASRSDIKEVKRQVDLLWSLIRAELFKYRR